MPTFTFEQGPVRGVLLGDDPSVLRRTLHDHLTSSLTEGTELEIACNVPHKFFMVALTILRGTLSDGIQMACDEGLFADDDEGEADMSLLNAKLLNDACGYLFDVGKESDLGWLSRQAVLYYAGEAIVLQIKTAIIEYSELSTVYFEFTSATHGRISLSLGGNTRGHSVVVGHVTATLRKLQIKCTLKQAQGTLESRYCTIGELVSRSKEKRKRALLDAARAVATSSATGSTTPDFGSPSSPEKQLEYSAGRWAPGSPAFSPPSPAYSPPSSPAYWIFPDSPGSFAGTPSYSLGSPAYSGWRAGTERVYTPSCPSYNPVYPLSYLRGFN